MHNKKSRVLFIVKKRIDSYGVSVGLINSAVFVANALNRIGIEAKVVRVIDNNSIDVEVSQFNPTHVIVEALWVVPEKFDALIALHPSVKWVVRMHSKTPFLAMEGIAIEWIRRYHAIALRHRKNFFLSSNSEDMGYDLAYALGIDSVLLLNIYEPTWKEKCWLENGEVFDDGYVDIACFGAIRPLKNHLIQAMSAAIFAKNIGRRLRFHVNANRIEQKADEILKNLRAMGSDHFKLVEHPWLPHEDFIKVVKTMDMGLQVSLSESFNIVTADFVGSGVIIVVSTDVDWMPKYAQASPNSAEDIVSKMEYSWRHRKSGIQNDNKKALERHNKTALDTWTDFLT